MFIDDTVYVEIWKNQQKIAFLYTNSEQVEFEIKNTIPFTFSTPENEIIMY